MSYLVDANKNSVNVANTNDPYTLTATDEIYLALDGQIVQLPDATSSNKGRTYNIKLNGTYTSGVVIKKPDTTTLYTINKDFGNVNIVSSGADWLVLADAIQVSQIATTTSTNNFQNDVVIEGGTLTFSIKDGSNNTVFSVDSNTGDTQIEGDLTITGSLIVNGTTTTINTVNLNVTDSLIQLSDGTTGAPVNDAGFIIARGDENNASLFWSEATDTFVFATATSLASDFTGNILLAGGTITYSTVRLGALEANTIGGIASPLTITGSLTGNADTATAWATAMTLSLGGTIATGSVSFDGSSSPTTLNLSLNDNSITNTKLVNSSINIGGSNIVLGGTLGLSNLAITGSTLGLSIGNDVITNTNLVNDSISIDGVPFALGDNLNVEGDTYITANVTGTTLGLSLGTIDNAILQYDSVRLGSYDLALGGTLSLSSDFSITGGTLGLTGTLSVYSTGAIALAKTINLAGAVTGSLDLNNQNTAVTINTTFGTITNADLQYSSLNIDGVNFALGSTLGITGDSYITANVTGTTLDISLGTIDNAKLQYDSVRVGSYDLVLGGTLGLSNLAVTGSTLGLNIGNDVISNDMLVNDSILIDGVNFALGSTLNLTGDSYITANVTGTTLGISLGTIDNAILANDSVRLGSYDLALGGTLSLSNLAITGSTLGLSTTINLTDNQASALDITQSTNSYLKFITTEGSEKVVVGKNLQLEGNLTVNGLTTTINSTTVTIDDPVFTLGGDVGSLTDDNKDRGIEFRWHNGTAPSDMTSLGNGQSYYIVSLGDTDFTQIGASSNTVGLLFTYNGNISQFSTTGTALISTALKTGFFGYDDSESAFTFIPDATNSSEVFSGNLGKVIFGSADLKGTLSLQSAGGVERASYNPVTGLSLKNSNDLTLASDANGNTVKFQVTGATGVTTLSTDASLKINKATTATSPLIVLNSDTTSTGHQDAVISVERGSGTDAKLTWDNTNTLWTADNATGTARPLFLHSPVDTSITTSTPVNLTGNAKGEYEKVYLVANSNTAITINLFALSSSYNGYKVIIKKIDSGTGTITISPNGSDTIDGANSSISISTSYGSATLIADATTGWWII